MATETKTRACDTAGAANRRAPARAVVPRILRRRRERFIACLCRPILRLARTKRGFADLRLRFLPALPCGSGTQLIRHGIPNFVAWANELIFRVFDRLFCLSLGI